MQKIFLRTDIKTIRATIRLYADEVRQDKKRFIAACILIPTGHLLYTVMLPLFLSLILQSLITQPQNIEVPLWLITGMVIASLGALIANNTGFRKLFNHEEYITTRLTERAMTELLAHSHQFFSITKVGSLAGDVTGFARSYLTVVDAIFLQASVIVVNFVASLIIIAFLSPILLVPLGALTIFIIWHSFRSMEKRAPTRNKRKKMMSQLNGNIADIMGNQLLVRAFSKAKLEISDVVSNRQDIEKLAAEEIEIIQTESNLRQGVLYIFQILTILICILLFNQNLITIAALVFAVTYFGRLTNNLFNLTSIFRTIEQGMLDAAPVTEIILRAQDVEDAQGAKNLIVSKGGITFDNVTFNYSDNHNETVFNNLNLTINPGQKIGLAGKSGGGKTTFTQLLLRFSNVQSGSIKIDGQDIAKVTQASLRKNIAYVPQEPFLFHRTLRENISYGKPGASDDEILKAAKRANATEFIDKLPNGLNTVVGERGVKLSGGQRQRIAIARAILKNAPILILDEATSALDSESEILVQKSLNELMKNRTSIVIAHRLSTIQKMDRIIVLHDGNIIEEGTHTKLLKTKGKYAELWAHQSGGFIEE